MRPPVRPSWPVRRLARCPAPGDDVVNLPSALAESGLANVFNPSIVCHGGALVAAFRAYGPGRTKPFHAYLAESTGGGGWQIRSLTEQAAAGGRDVVADPKLFTWGDRVFATFNTGTPESGPNEILVMQVWPHHGPPRRCVLEPRQRIEKNWGFFEHGGRLRVLYSIAPLLILDLDDRLAAADAADRTGPLVLRATARPAGASDLLSLTIGTQPLSGGRDGPLRLVGHEKLYVGRRRAYVGRCVSVSGLDDPTPQVRVGRTRLVHSWHDAAAWRRPAHNPNLLSATYFAGMMRAGDDYVLSYGVNDVAFGLAQVGGDLWPA